MLCVGLLVVFAVGVGEVRLASEKLGGPCKSWLLLSSGPCAARGSQEVKVRS